MFWLFTILHKVPIKVWIDIAVTGIIVVLVSAAWMHYTYIRDDRDSLIAAKAELTQNLATATTAFNTYKASSDAELQRIQAQILDLQDKYNSERQYASALKTELDKKNISITAIKDPTSASTDINSITQRLFNDLQSVSQGGQPSSIPATSP